MSFYVKKFDSSLHLAMLKEWQKASGCDPYPWDLLPSHGWIVYGDDGACAASFAREAEKGVVIIDYLIVNPEDHPKGACNVALNAVETFAEGTGAKAVVAWSRRYSVAKLGKANGYHVQENMSVGIKLIGVK